MTANQPTFEEAPRKRGAPLVRRAAALLRAELRAVDALRFPGRRQGTGTRRIGRSPDVWPRSGPYSRTITQTGGTQMFTITLRYTRYALSALASVAFSASLQ